MDRERGDGDIYVVGKRRGAVRTGLARSGGAKPSCADTPTQWKTLRNIEPWPRRGILKLHENLTKEQSAIAVQMRTGKIGLRQFLYSRKVPGIDSAICECRGGHQTVEHVLIACRKYRAERRGFWDQEKGKVAWGELQLKKILTEPDSLKKAVIFMKDTGP